MAHAMTDVHPAESSRDRPIGGRTLRLLLGFATAGLFLSARAPVGITVDAFNVVLLVLMCSATVVLVATAVPTMVGVLAVMTTVWSGVGFSGWLVLTASLLYTMHLLAGLCEVIPATARIERGALRPSLLRWIYVHLATVPVLALLTAFL